MTDAWYSFTSAVSYRMPEYCVPPLHCGTNSPVWMNGTHPTGNTYFYFWMLLLSVFAALNYTGFYRLHTCIIPFLIVSYYRSGNCPYCSYSAGDFEDFTTQGRHDSRISVKFGILRQLFRPALAHPLLDVVEIRRVYADNRSTEVVNIWCDSVGKLRIYRPKKSTMRHSPQ